MEIMVVGCSLNFSTDAHVDYWNISLLSLSVNTDAISFIPPPSLFLLFLSLTPSLYVLLSVILEGSLTQVSHHNKKDWLLYVQSENKEPLSLNSIRFWWILSEYNDNIWRTVKDHVKCTILLNNFPRRRWIEHPWMDHNAKWQKAQVGKRTKSRNKQVPPRLKRGMWWTLRRF